MDSIGYILEYVCLYKYIHAISVGKDNQYVREEWVECIERIGERKEMREMLQLHYNLKNKQEKESI